MDRTEEVVLTPAMAQEFLKVNVINRPLTRSIVDSWRAIYERGEYVKTHQGMAFSDTKLMLDGQHRCVAMAEMPEGFSVRMNVTFDLPEAAFSAMDVGRKRTASEVLRESQRLVECARFLARLYLGRSNLVTPAYLVQFVDVIRGTHDRLVAFCPASTKMWTSGPVRAAAVMSVLAGQDEDFIHIVYRSLATSDFDAMTQSAQTLYKAHVSGSLRATNSHDTYAKALKVFDVRQQTLKVIKVLDIPTVIGSAREFLQTLLDDDQKRKAPIVRAPSRSVQGLKFTAVSRAA